MSMNELTPCVTERKADAKRVFAAGPRCVLASAAPRREPSLGSLQSSQGVLLRVTQLSKDAQREAKLLPHSPSNTPSLPLLSVFL